MTLFFSLVKIRLSFAERFSLKLKWTGISQNLTHFSHGFYYFRQMKSALLLSLILVVSLPLKAQNKNLDSIAMVLTDDQILSPLIYLASDQLKGRFIGLPEIDTAAAYLAGRFFAAGAKPVPGDSGYYQLFSHQFSPRERYHMNKQIAANIPFSIRHGILLKNVLAFVKGTDPLLRTQYIILSAHYDHAGMVDPAIPENGKLDCIFNGARDNATGTAAVIAAAKYFARFPPKRSVLFIGYSAEEEGEIGSNYYADHPLVPLDRTVFNLNVDNAGYNTTHAVCLFGLGRTSADSLVQKACLAYGLAVLPEPEGQRFFERSDNYPLAEKGIPAPCYSMGMKNWDKAVEEHYHRVSDEVENMDLAYVTKFIRAYILSAKYIANDYKQPEWTKDDPFEKDWKTLFGRER